MIILFWEKGRIMKRRYEKYGIRYRILILFSILVIIPFLILSGLALVLFQKHATDSFGKNMGDTLIAVSNQVRLTINKYEEDTMSFYYSGLVEQLPANNSDETKVLIQSALDGFCYSNSDVMAAYLVCDNQIYSSGDDEYGNLLEVMEPYTNDIVQAKGKCRWYPTNKLYGKAKSHNYVLARSLNSKKQTNVAILYLVISEKMISESILKLESKEVKKEVVDNTGTILFSTKRERIGTRFENKDVLEKRKMKYQVITINKEKVVIAYCYLDRQGWYFLSTIEFHTMLKSVAGLRNIFIVVSVVYMMFLFMMLFMLSHYIFKPMERLKDKMDLFSEGQLHTQMEQTAVGELKRLTNHFNTMTTKIRELMRTNEQAIREQESLKMKALVAQIKPHFIYNSLNTIKWMAVINKQENIRQMTEAIIRILMNVTKIKEDHYTLKEELDLIESYTTIQKARFMNFDLSIDTKIEVNQYQIRKFILQPIVENAIIHGFGKKNTYGLIQIKIWKDEKLKIEISDNGVGFSVDEWRAELAEKKDEEHTNIGIQNIEQLIELECGKEYGVKISSKLGEGTVVKYELPLIRK